MNIIFKILPFCFLLAVPAFSQPVDDTSVQDWEMAMSACQQHPEHQGCVRLRSRYEDTIGPGVRAKVRSDRIYNDFVQRCQKHPEISGCTKDLQIRTPLVIPENPDPSIIDKVLQVMDKQVVKSESMVSKAPSIPLVLQQPVEPSVLEWEDAMKACQQHPEHQGCEALKSRYDVAKPHLLTSGVMTSTNPDPSIIDKVMHNTEHMAFSKEFYQ